MVFSIQSELETDDRPINSFNRKRKNHIEDEELSFQPVWNIITSSSRMIHGTDVGKIFNTLEITSLSFIEPIETSLLNKLSYNLKCNLITPFIDERHTQIINEDGQ